MSRFVEILNRFRGQIAIKGFHSILEEMKKRLDAEAAHVEITFPFFLKRSEVTENFQIRQYDCSMHCQFEREDDLRLDIKVPVSHSFSLDQNNGTDSTLGLWGNVFIRVRFLKFMWLEDLIGVVEDTISDNTEKENGSVAAEPIEPMESLLERLEARFSELSELKWYSITVEKALQGYSLFATMDSDSCTAG